MVSCLMSCLSASCPRASSELGCSVAPAAVQSTIACQRSLQGGYCFKVVPALVGFDTS
jgi:hypothetical protein